MNAPTASRPTRLDSELVEAAGVDEPSRAGGEVRGEGGNGEDPGRERAPDAREAVHGNRADRVVDPDPLDEEDADDRDRAATNPITTAAHGATKPEAAVMATSAAMTPFSIIEMSGF